MKEKNKSKINIELVSIIIEQKDYPFGRGYFSERIENIKIDRTKKIEI